MIPIGYGRHEILVTNPTAISKVHSTKEALKRYYIHVYR